jgi:hypothetical protein
MSSITNKDPRATKSGKNSKANTGFDYPVKKSAENDIQMLLREAYDESNHATPIMMLITHSVEILDAVKEF